MIINGIGKRIEFYKTDKKLTFDRLEKKLNLSKRSIQNIIDTDNVVKTETFFRLFRLLNLDVVEFLKSETMTQITNQIGVQNGGTVNHIDNSNSSKKELELIIEHQKKEIESLQKSVQYLEQRLKDKDMIIELLKNK